MATFADLNDFFRDGLDLPIGGKVYRVPPADAATGLFCQKLMTVGINAANGKQIDEAELTDDGEKDLYRRVLGTAFDEMIEDGVSWAKIKHCGITAFLWIAGDEDSAAKYWQADPEAEAPKETARTAGRSTR
ncbi:DUF7426 family protein [Streptosporangium saharense]|uniref:DUF7426 domain-containing protein n=1 Tax=Streptosporangium saharense TaxID=1706840 RepID=A0A7W7QKC9_9ACTN|nr:hypothetical protein [Streptosporangium saharense]MBB4915098.1 hypothetical protein [Streptosporangium saharense]